MRWFLKCIDINAYGKIGIEPFFKRIYASADVA